MEHPNAIPESSAPDMTFANAYMGALIDAMKECFKEHPLAGLDSRFTDLDVGRESTGPTWLESIIDFLS